MVVPASGATPMARLLPDAAPDAAPGAARRPDLRGTDGLRRDLRLLADGFLAEGFRPEGFLACADGTCGALAVAAADADALAAGVLVAGVSVVLIAGGSVVGVLAGGVPAVAPGAGCADDASAERFGVMEPACALAPRRVNGVFWGCG